MGGWLALIPFKVKVALLVGAAFVIGLLRWRSVAIEKALQDLRNKQDLQRANNIRAAVETKHEVETLDDVGLAARASKWLRKD